MCIRNCWISSFNYLHRPLLARGRSYVKLHFCVDHLMRVVSISCCKWFFCKLGELENSKWQCYQLLLHKLMELHALCCQCILAYLNTKQFGKRVLMLPLSLFTRNVSQPAQLAMQFQHFIQREWSMQQNNENVKQHIAVKHQRGFLITVCIKLLLDLPQSFDFSGQNRVEQVLCAGG